LKQRSSGGHTEGERGTATTATTEEAPTLSFSLRGELRLAFLVRSFFVAVFFFFFSRPPLFLDFTSGTKRTEKALITFPTHAFQHEKKKKKTGKNDSEEKRELIFKEDGQEYAQVLKMLGNNRLDAQCIDGVKRLAHIRGKMRKKVWVNAGDVVLVGLRDYQDGKADVILKYSAEEARALKAYGELPESLRINEATEALGGTIRFPLFFHVRPRPFF
jgi:translation initiation factor 1A